MYGYNRLRTQVEEIVTTELGVVDSCVRAKDRKAEKTTWPIDIS
jgi:hypothetical protein